MIDDMKQMYVPSWGRQYISEFLVLFGEIAGQLSFPVSQPRIRTSDQQ